ncbi:MAG: SEL1-like repeat protein [Verrucomicrobia bacterium]|nr:SEL1-like repeat protein [Verrucomicrobiota bacterium]
MIKLRLTFIGGLLLCLGLLQRSIGASVPPEDLTPQMRSEQKHFLDCLAVVYSPAFWISYNDSLYFQARNEAQFRQLETMKAARSNYQVLTNRETRHALVAKLIAASGIGESRQKQILLPFSDTNLNLTPTLEKPLRVVPKYKVLTSPPQGDVLIQDDDSVYFVMNFGRGADDSLKKVDAFADVALSAEETAVLNRVVAAFQKRAASLTQEIAAPKAKQEFEDCRLRATDSNPYMQFKLARCYLDGKGTDKDEELGLVWMKKAAKNGSGDATAYLEKLGRKVP